MTWDEIVLALADKTTKGISPSFSSGDYIVLTNDGYTLKSDKGDIFNYNPSLSEQQSSDWITT